MKRAAALIALALLASPAVAQKKMYRCGSQYQDRPCDSAKAKAPDAPPTAPASTSSSAQEDKREAQKRIRCENFGRQRDELRDKQRASNKAVADSMGAQLKALEDRIRNDGC